MKSSCKILVSICLMLLCLPAYSQSFFNSNVGIDTAKQRIDSMIHQVNIKDTAYRIYFLRDRMPNQQAPISNKNEEQTNWLAEQAPLTILILEHKTNKLVFSKKFESATKDFPQIHWQLLKGHSKTLEQAGKLFLSVEQYNGGSSSSNSLYWIELTNGMISLNKIYEAPGELSDWALSKNEDEMMVLTGIWNAKEQEAHFSKHRYQLKKIQFAKNGILPQDLGRSSLKYAPIDEEMNAQKILLQILLKEPVFAKKIEKSKY